MIFVSPEKSKIEAEMNVISRFFVRNQFQSRREVDELESCKLFLRMTSLAKKFLLKNGRHFKNEKYV